MKHKVLFVDDEANVLRSLWRVVQDEEYETLQAPGGKEGLEILREHEVSVIVSDMRMPGMDGIAFLKEARTVRPEAVALVLSGYADIQSIMQAINEGRIWRYITKPWEDSDLLLTIRNAIGLFEKEADRRRLLEELKVKNRLLAEVNEQLEERVRERTWELRARTEILNMLLEDASLPEVMRKILATACRSAGAQWASARVSFLDERFDSDPGAISPEAQALLKRVADAGELSATVDAFAVPVHKGEQLLGALGVGGVEESNATETAQQLESLVSLLALALSLHKAAADAPNLLERIDELIEDL